MFKRLKIHDWRQFDKVDLEFHPRLTVLTGANGSGKTTILHILNRHLGWSVDFVSTPERTRSGPLRYLSGLSAFVLRMINNKEKAEAEIGTIEYENQQIARLAVPNLVGRQYGLTFTDMQSVPGFYIPSHRSTYKSEHIKEIPLGVPTPEEIISQYFSQAQRSIAKKVANPQTFQSRKL